MLRDPRFAPLVPRIDFSRMRRVELAVADAADRPFRPDLLFEAPLLGAEGDAFVLLLPIPEHKWHLDPLAAWQATRYQIRILEAFRALPGNETRWPLVVSILFYHGLRRWTAAMQLRDLFALPPGLADADARALRELQPNGTYLLCDLRREPESEFDERKLPLIAFLGVQFLRHLPASTEEELRRHLVRLRRFLVGLAELPDGKPFLGALFFYLLATSRVPPTELHATIRSILPPPTTETIMNHLESMLKKAHDEGLDRGRREAEADVLLRQLAKRFGPLPDGVVTRIRAATPPELDTWALRLLDARGLDEVFAG